MRLKFLSSIINLSLISTAGCTEFAEVSRQTDFTKMGGKSTNVNSPENIEPVIQRVTGFENTAIPKAMIDNQKEGNTRRNPCFGLVSGFPTEGKVLNRYSLWYTAAGKSCDSYVNQSVKTILKQDSTAAVMFIESKDNSSVIALDGNTIPSILEASNGRISTTRGVGTISNGKLQLLCSDEKRIIDSFKLAPCDYKYNPKKEKLSYDKFDKKVTSNATSDLFLK